MSDSNEGLIQRVFYTPKTALGEGVVLIELLSLLWMAGCLVVLAVMYL